MSGSALRGGGGSEGLNTALAAQTADQERCSGRAAPKGVRHAMQWWPSSRECQPTDGYPVVSFQRPKTMTRASKQMTTVRTLARYSRRVVWKTVAHSINTATPHAAPMVSRGRIPVAAGRMRPTPPSISLTPMKRTKRGESVPNAGRFWTSLSIGWNVCMLPAKRKNAPPIACRAQRTMFTGVLLLVGHHAHECHDTACFDSAPKR